MTRINIPITAIIFIVVIVIIIIVIVVVMVGHCRQHRHHCPHHRDRHLNVHYDIVMHVIALFIFTTDNPDKPTPLTQSFQLKVSVYTTNAIKVQVRFN